MRTSSLTLFTSLGSSAVTSQNDDDDSGDDEGYGKAHLPGERLGKKKTTDARTAVAVIGLIETVEHASDFLWCHASSRVSDAQCEPSCLLFECGGDFDADFPTLRCEFKGVPEQVEENTFHLFFIKPEFLRRVGAVFGVYS